MPPPGPDVAEPPSSSPPPGLSEFLGGVLDQLSLTAWFPAAMLVANLAVLLQLRAQPRSGLAEAVGALTDKPLGVLVVLLFALLLAALVTQSLEFSAIRLLEGYWGTGALLGAVATWRIRRHLRQRERCLERAGGLEAAAFGRVRADLARLPGVDPLVVAAVEARFHDRDVSSFDPAVLALADAVDWREEAPPGLLRRMAAFDDRFAGYPTASRVMPTRLGNTLRSTEDELKHVDGDLRGFVVRNLDRIPRALLQEHDQYRNRLDMYCMFVLVCAVLAAAGPALLLGARDDPAFGVASAVGYLVLAAVGYRAAVASGRGYATTLRAIDARLDVS